MANFSTARKTSFRKGYYVVCVHPFDQEDDLVKGELYQVKDHVPFVGENVGDQMLDVRHVKTGDIVPGCYSGRFYLVGWADNPDDKLQKVVDNVPHLEELFAQAWADWNYEPPEFVTADTAGTGKGGPGLKDDGGKIMASLPLMYFPEALLQVAEVATMGAKKYSIGGWRMVPDKEQRYSDALCRHLLQCNITDLDDESGLPHLAHAAWNILAVLQIKLEKQRANTTGPDEA